MTFVERSAPIDGRTIDVATDYTRLWEGIHERVGPDHTGVPTVGHGFALVVKVKGKWGSAISTSLCGTGKRGLR